MPLADPRAYKTYSIHQPLATHFRPATCAEVDCPHYLEGWMTRVEHCNAEQLHAARNSGRRYRELALRPGETYLHFEAGQKCFHWSDHRTPVGRPELYVIRDGDARGNPTGRRDLVSGETWNDDFGEHQERLADLLKEG